MCRSRKITTLPTAKPTPSEKFEHSTLHVATVIVVHISRWRETAMAQGGGGWPYLAITGIVIRGSLKYMTACLWAREFSFSWLG